MANCEETNTKPRVNLDIVQDLPLDDYISVMIDGCLKLISKKDFLNGVLFFGEGFCEAVNQCNNGIGIFTPITPPTFVKAKMEDVDLLFQNREEKSMDVLDFTNNYIKNDGGEFEKIIISGGDLSNFKFNGQPIYIGLSINKNEIHNLKYKGHNIDVAYSQLLLFDAYDINNVKADL